MTNVTEEKPASKWVVYGGILWFASMGLSALFFSISSFADLLIDIYTQSETIQIHKGLYYGFGGGVVLMIFVASGVYSKILNKELSHTMNRLLIRLLVVSIVVMLALPHVINYVASNFLENRSYQMCEPDRIQWPVFRTNVYTKSFPCDEH